MNKIGILYAYWTRNWSVDFHPFIDKAADLGFDVLEVQAGVVTDMTSTERNKLKEHAEKRKIDLCYCIGLSPEYDLASPDESIRQNGILYLQKMAKAVGSMGGKMISGIVYGCWPTRLPEGETDTRPYLERSISSMKKAIKTAEDQHVQFNLEVVNRFEHYLLNSCDEALEYIQRVDSPNVKIHLDTFHMNIEEDSIGHAIEKAGENLGHVHIGENNRTPPGSGNGHIPWDELVKAIKKIQYRGYIVMEPFTTPGGEVGRDIRIYRDLRVSDPDQEAKKALQFIRNKFQAVN
jgi:D-psicose/D-tagatose/L-ribulose 3-epimerase